MTGLRRLPVALLGALAAVVLLGGCGGGADENGIDKLSADDAITKIRAALDKVESVHVSGHVSLNGKTMTLDLRDKASGGTGTLRISGGEIDVVRDGDTVYVKGDAAALEATGASAFQASLAGGKWLKSSAGASSQFGALGSLLDIDALFANITTATAELRAGKRTTVDGEKAYTLLDKATDGNGVLYVALTGEPLPLRVDQPGGGGSIDFEYGVPVTVTPPSGAIDLSKLGG